MNDPTPISLALFGPRAADFRATWTLAPKWALCSGGIVNWRATRKPNHLGDPSSKDKK